MKIQINKHNKGLTVLEIANERDKAKRKIKYLNDEN